MIAPFFPIEAQRKGVSLLMIGLIIGIYSVAVIINSLIVGKIMHYFGRSNITTIGLLFMGTSMLGFAFSHYIEDKNTFIAVSLLVRFLQGIASSSIQTSVYSMITIIYPDKMEKVIGYIEATMAVALVIGPLFGSILFYFGGYQAPFVTIGIIFYIFVIIGRRNILSLEKVIEVQKNTEEIRKEINSKRGNSFDHHLGEEIDVDVDKSIFKLSKSNISQGQSSEKLSKENKSKCSNGGDNKFKLAKIPILKLLNYKQFVFAMMSGSLGYFIGSFVEPILALRMKETYNFSDSTVALFFIIHFMGYLIFSPLVQYIPKRFEKRIIMMFGSLTAFVTLIFYGPSKMLNMPEDWHLMLIGLILMGCAITF
jgi:MFS family permease